MSLENVLTIIFFLCGVIGTLVFVVYRILAVRIDEITKTHNDLAVNLSSIKTDIRWIKDKLNKL